MALDVDAAPAGAPGQLGVFRGGEVDVGLPVEFHELLEDDGTSGHVDAEREGLGGKDGADGALGEEFLDDLPEGGSIRRGARRAAGDPFLESSSRGRRDPPRPVRLVRSSTRRRFRSLTSSSTSRMPLLNNCWTAPSHPARLNTNVIAGSRPSWSRARTTSVREAWAVAGAAAAPVGGRPRRSGSPPRPRAPRRADSADIRRSATRIASVR